MVYFNELCKVIGRKYLALQFVKNGKKIKGENPDEEKGNESRSGAYFI